MPLTVERDFVYTYRSKEERCTLTAPVTIPLETSIDDLVGRLIKAHCLPCFAVNGLKTSLTAFQAEETGKFYVRNSEEALRKFQENVDDVDDLVDQWAKVFTQELKEYAKPVEISNDQVFSEVYHNLIHSPALETLLNLEHTYAIAVEDVITQRDRDLNHFEIRQSKEMEDAVSLLGTVYTDVQVNQLAQRQFENTQMIESKWASELSNLQETQKREYREWVMKVHEDTQTSHGTPSFVQRVRALTNNMPEPCDDDGVPQPRMEESFTIHLGAQQKTMHNLRLLCVDILDLCRHKPNKVGGMLIPSPQRLQTAMSLYSNNLSALILLVDNRLNSYTGIKREFAKVCEQSTDFHLPNLEQQFQSIEQNVVKGNEWRVLHKVNEDGDRVSLKSTSSEGSREDRSNRMHVGDFYTTRHSNLSDVHVAFHLVTDETLTSPDISSRHPVILGIRNILKMCFRYDIFTLSIPLLLTHEMSEEMTVQWCNRRAELVFKCVKGFMMEMASWGGQSSRTIQFIVPKGCSEKMFTEFSSMLPGIFRVSNPVKG
ncbi:FERRY endosomal RAB5 effector complex subunit 3-like [Tubulanus polymorphus]|uniref:FERRY endosomal RAB5 effector complex subunit 3-like n=1 Tax=Tubulanus polymorphus TaxID=672921 RepID=UPI003DA27F7A